ncbi:MAG: hypothetical protein HZB56_08235 [Deltaproteobacteria bacterium]|nr:hypothetical protein [Deltaproteobacteria bacterium]
MTRDLHRATCRAAALATLLAGMAVAREPETPGIPLAVEPSPLQAPAPEAPPAAPAEAPPAPPAGAKPLGPPTAAEAESAEAKPLGPPTAAEAASAEGQTWADDSHRALERKLTDLTEDLDRIFGEDRRLDLEQPGSYLRWRGEVRLDDRRTWSLRSSARANVQLPALMRWLKGLQLSFSGESKGDPVVRRLEEPGNPGFSPSIRAEQAHLELRLDLLRTPSPTVLQAASGVRLRWPFEYFGALRFRHRQALGWKITARFTQEGTWTNRERFGELTQVDLDRPLSAQTQLRWNNAGFITGVSRGYEWATEVGLAHAFQRLRLASYLGFAVSGFGLPKAEVELYRLFTRVRRDVWRRWLFLELEPEVAWPTTPGLGRHHVLALTLRVDIILDGRAPHGEPSAVVPPPAPPGS